MEWGLCNFRPLLALFNASLFFQRYRFSLGLFLIESFLQIMLDCHSESYFDMKVCYLSLQIPLQLIQDLIFLILALRIYAYNFLKEPISAIVDVDVESDLL